MNLDNTTLDKTTFPLQTKSSVTQEPGFQLHNLNYANL